MLTDEGQYEEFSYGDYVPLSLISEVSCLQSTLSQAPSPFPPSLFLAATPTTTLSTPAPPSSAAYEQWLAYVTHACLQGCMELSPDGRAVRAVVQDDPNEESDNDSDFGLQL